VSRANDDAAGRYDASEVKKRVEAAARPLFVALRGGPLEGSAPPAPPRPPSWAIRASLPMPHAWPPTEASLVDVSVYAYSFSGIADGERQAAPFARAVVHAGSGALVRLESLGTGFREVGVQSVQPVPPAFWTAVDASVQRLLEAVLSGALPSEAAAAEIRAGYCAVFRFNSLQGKEQRDLYPAFFTWLACPAPP
jgi:hypothetical protein